jgi:hypothetical protein
VDERPHELEYAQPSQKLPTQFDDFVTGLFVGRLSSRWFYQQLAYYLALTALFLAIVFPLSNYLLFNKVSRPTAVDFVSEVENYCVPVVRAMEEFQRDNGRLPNGMDELVPKYLPDQSHQPVQPVVDQGEFRHYGRDHHTIWYDFTPGSEGWKIRGPYVNGQIPLPPVKVGPSTRPTTQPN